MIISPRWQLARYLSEFVGTAILVCAIKMILAASTLTVFGGLYIGLTLLVIVYLYGYNSLGMFNPAVTIGQFIRNSETFGHRDTDQNIQFLIYLVVQFLGGIAGGFFAGIAGGKAAGYMYTFVNHPTYDVNEAFF